MHFTRCTRWDLNEAVNVANAEHGYDLEYQHTSENGSSFRGRILPTSSFDKGARRSPSGRRVKAACWHAHRDVLAALFDMRPDARVQTSMADYNGRERFQDAFPETYYANHGSMMSPAYYGELCDCEE